MNNIEINNIKETALLVILDSVELEKTGNPQLDRVD